MYLNKCISTNFLRVLKNIISNIADFDSGSILFVRHSQSTSSLSANGFSNRKRTSSITGRLIRVSLKYITAGEKSQLYKKKKSLKCVKGRDLCRPPNCQPAFFFLKRPMVFVSRTKYMKKNPNHLDKILRPLNLHPNV